MKLKDINADFPKEFKVSRVPGINEEYWTSRLNKCREAFLNTEIELNIEEILKVIVDSHWRGGMSFDELSKDGKKDYLRIAQAIANALPTLIKGKK